MARLAIAYAREVPDVLISYLHKHADARDTVQRVEKAGSKTVLVSSDVADPAHCRTISEKVVEELWRVDLLVNNAAFQMSRHSLEEIPNEKWGRMFAINISAMFHWCKDAVPHMRPSLTIIGNSYVNFDTPVPALAPYAATKTAITKEADI